MTNDLKWSSNTNYICKKAYKKMWVLRRMKLLDVDPYIICDVYEKEIRPLLELAVPAWHSGLTIKQSEDIERVQKVAVQVILSNCTTGKSDFSYDMGLVVLSLEPLYVRRDRLCLSFATKTLKSRHKNIFVINESEHCTRRKPKFRETKCNT